LALLSVSWLREFDDPIETPDGTRLNTLREAVAYLAKTVPKSEREIAWVFLARMATLQAIHRHEARQFNPDRKDTQWGKRKLKRDQ
jgi:hypothetical protein